VPSFLPGEDLKHYGIIRRGAKLIYAFAEATVQTNTVNNRKDLGGAYIVMRSKKLVADLNLHCPTAQIGVVGAPIAVNILYLQELLAVEQEGGDVEARRAELIEKYETALLNPYEAADSGYIDAVIAPSETRAHVVRALRATVAKRESRPARKHGNIPL